MERCSREIVAIEVELLAGNPDVTGLLLGYADWHGSTIRTGAMTLRVSTFRPSWPLRASKSEIAPVGSDNSPGALGTARIWPAGLKLMVMSNLPEIPVASLMGGAPGNKPFNCSANWVSVMLRQVISLVANGLVSRGSFPSSPGPSFQLGRFAGFAFLSLGRADANS
jgi:hypothetical protein